MDDSRNSSNQENSAETKLGNITKPFLQKLTKRSFK